LHFAQLSLDHNASIYASCLSLDDRYIPPILAFSFEMGGVSRTFCTTGLELQFSWSQASHIAWDDRCTPPHPAIGLDGWGLTNFLPGLAWNLIPFISAFK
jgi:hypothetical protein